jgi:hypothetical protein
MSRERIAKGKQSMFKKIKRKENGMGKAGSCIGSMRKHKGNSKKVRSSLVGSGGSEIISGNRIPNTMEIKASPVT